MIFPSLRGSEPGATSEIFGLRPTISFIDAVTRLRIASIEAIVSDTALETTSTLI